MPGGHKQAAFAGEGEAVVVARAIEQLEHAIPAPAPPVGPCLNALEAMIAHGWPTERKSA